MARGSSNRIVVEVDIETKNDLYAVLAKDNLTLKQWFLNNVEQYIKDQNQPSLFAAKEKSKKRVAEVP